MPEKIAVVLIRSVIGTSMEVRDTLRMLGLKRKNHCAILEKNLSMVGMVNKVKDLITWGEVGQETIDLLSKRMVDGVAHLTPPRKGFGRKGIKVHFSVGGGLGYRGEKIKDLLQRMV